jgi:hypothetical protein
VRDGRYFANERGRAVIQLRIDDGVDDLGNPEAETIAVSDGEQLVVFVTCHSSQTQKPAAAMPGGRTCSFSIIAL